MDKAIELLCKSIGVSALLYLNYCILLRNRQFHAFNRMYLLGTIAVSIVFPFMPVTTVIISHGASEVTRSSSTPVMLYGTVVMFLLLHFVISICKLYRIKRRSSTIKIGNITVIETQLDEAPFSFFNYMFWRKDISIQSAEGKKIWAHEFTHISQKHSYDKMILHITACVGWINPLYWVIKKEIGIVHEFLADEKSVDRGDTASFASMLLRSSQATGYFHPGQSFFQSPVRRRLKMIRTIEGNHFVHLRKWSVFPVAMVISILCSFSVQTKYSILQKQHAEKLAAEKAALK